MNRSDGINFKVNINRNLDVKVTAIYFLLEVLPSSESPLKAQVLNGIRMIRPLGS